MDPRRAELQAFLAALKGARADGSDGDDIRIHVCRGHACASLCSASDLSTQLRSAAIGVAPDWRASTWPWCMSSREGTARTGKSVGTAGDWSTSTLTSFNCPARSAASCSNAGLTIRHGPHQVAHKSTSTGTEAFSTTRAKSGPPAEAIHGSHWWQLAQRGFPSAAAGTRFRLPQCGQVTVVGSMVPASGRRGRRGVGDGEFVTLDIDVHSAAARDLAAEQSAADPGLDFVGDVSAQGPCPVNWIVPALGDQPTSLRCDVDINLILCQPISQFIELKLDDSLDLWHRRRGEQHDVVDPVEELGTELCSQFCHYPLAGVGLDFAVGGDTVE